MAMCRAVYQSGYTRSGQAIVVVVGRHFPIHLPIHIVESHYVQVRETVFLCFTEWSNIDLNITRW